MIIYQLVAKGSTQFFQEAGVIYSRTLFKTRAAAESHIPKFRINVVTPRGGLDLTSLEENSVLTIKIVELELED